MSKKDQELNNALAAFEGKTAAALKAEVKAQLRAIDLDNLEIVPDEELAAEDAVHKSRLLYVVSLLRLLAFLRKAPQTWEDAEKQARLGLAYMKHAETQGLKNLQPGRSSGDERMLQEVAALKVQLQEMIEYRAKALVQKRDAEETGQGKRLPRQTGEAGADPAEAQVAN